MTSHQVGARRAGGRSAWAEARRDPVLRAASMGAAGWMVLYAAALWVVRDSVAGQQVVGQLLYLVPIAAVAALSVVAARRATSPRWFWRLLALSNLLWLGGDLTWAGYTYLLHREAPFPSVADASYLGSYAVVPLAVLAGFRTRGRLVSLRGLLDAGVVAAALGTTGWHLLVAPQLQGGLDAATATGIAYPLLGVVILVTLLAVTFSAHRAVPVSVVGVAMAFAISAVTDTGYTYATVLHSYVPGGWLNLGWQLEAVVMAVAVLAALRAPDDAAREQARGRDLTLVPVLVSIVAVLALVLADLRDGVAASAGVLAALAVLVLVVVRFATTLVDLRRTTRRLDEALQEQERLAVTDGLTGLYNRRMVNEVLVVEVARAQRTRRPLALLAVDVDHFKRVNDTHGHPAGDAVLVEVARRLETAVRDTDVVARTGGEEFVVLAADTGPEAALEVAERVRRAVGGPPVLASGPGTRAPVRVTVSVGIAVLEGGDAPEGLARRADRALYAAKAAGRDRVVGAERPVAAVR